MALHVSRRPKPVPSCCLTRSRRGARAALAPPSAALAAQPQGGSRSSRGPCTVHLHCLMLVTCRTCPGCAFHLRAVSLALLASAVSFPSIQVQFKQTQRGSAVFPADDENHAASRSRGGSGCVDVTAVVRSAGICDLSAPQEYCRRSAGRAWCVELERRVEHPRAARADGTRRRTVRTRHGTRPTHGAAPST